MDARSPTRAPARVLLAEDHELVRAGLRLLLETMSHVRVVGEAASGLQLLELTRRCEADLVILDLVMPEMDGLDAMAELCRRSPRPRCIALTMRDEDEIAQRARALGIEGFVVKGSSPQELAQAVAAVLRGETYYSPLVKGHPLATATTPSPSLTRRQHQVLQLIAQGHATKEIAFRLGLSAKTVAVHRARIMERLGIRDVAGLVLYSLRQGLIGPFSSVPRRARRPAAPA